MKRRKKSIMYQYRQAATESSGLDNEHRKKKEDEKVERELYEMEGSTVGSWKFYYS